MFLYYWKLEFFWTMEDQDKNQRYYLRMPVMLVFCLVVMISIVLCLLNILCFVQSLSGRNLFLDWAIMVVSLKNGPDCWVYSEMPLSSSMGLPWKIDPVSAWLTFCTLELSLGFPHGSSVKNPPASAEDIRDVGLIPGSERSSWEGHGNWLQYSCW